MIKEIFILWFQGFNNAPDIVKKCLKSWLYYNSDWNINIIDDSNLKNYIKLEEYIDVTNKQINKTALSDFIRCVLLKKYGGLWVDATTFCNKSLNDWLPNYINEGFFAFDKPAPDRLISSWFLYSQENNYIINSWCKSVINYYKINNNPHNYFWFHYLFGDLYKSDSNFKQVWDRVPKLSANGLGPHYIYGKGGMFNNITYQVKKDIDDKITPLYKLTYKCEFLEYDETKNLYYLYSTVK